MMSSAFATERTLRNRLQELLQTAPHLRESNWAAIRAGRPPLWLRVLKWLLAALSVPAVGGMAWLMLHLIHVSVGPVCVLAIVGYFSAAGMLGFAQRIKSGLRQSPVVSQYACLPARDRLIAERVWNRHVPETLWGLGLLLIAFSVIAYENQFSLEGWWIALGLAVLHWGYNIAIGTWLAQSLSRLRFDIIASWMIFVPLTAIPFRIVPWVDVTAWVLFALPSSWSGTALWEGYMNGNPLGWCPLIPVAGLVVALPWLRLRLVKAYRILEFALKQGEQPCVVRDGEMADGESWWRWRTVPAPDDVTDRVTVAHQIRKRESICNDWTTRGWMERLIAARLTPQERAMVVLVTGDTPEWSKGWRFHFIYGVILLAIPYVFPQFTMTFAAVCTGMIGLITLFAQWQKSTTSAARITGFHSSGLALVPVSARSISQVMTRVAIIRSLLHAIVVLPFLVITQGPMGLVTTLAFAAVYVKLQGLETELHFVRCWNAMAFSWSRLGYRLIHSVTYLATYAAVVFALIGCTQGPWMLSAAGVLLLLVGGAISLRYVAWLIDSGRVDLVRT